MATVDIEKMYGRLTFQKPANTFLYGFKNLEAYPGLMLNVRHLCQLYVVSFVGSISEIFYIPPKVEYGYSLWYLTEENRKDFRFFGSEEEAKGMKVLLGL